MTGTPPDSFTLTTNIVLPDEVTTHLKQAEQLREQSRQAQSSAAAEVRQAARLLAEQGLSLCDSSFHHQTAPRSRRLRVSR